MRLLAAREHSFRELHAKLVGKGFADPLVTEVLDRLQRRGDLSDERFTECFVRSRRGKGVGPIRVRAELRERGVATSLIEQYVDDQAGEWMEALKDAHRKKFGEAAHCDRLERARRLRFLQQRGFTHNQLRRLFSVDV